MGRSGLETAVGKPAPGNKEEAVRDEAELEVSGEETLEKRLVSCQKQQAEGRTGVNPRRCMQPISDSGR